MTLYAVNGKEPIAAWIPSLDTAGNGTTTLTDLVGSNNGTLTNMDAATDWVSDTSNGGVRALDFDGVNDYVEIADDVALQFGTGDFTISMWIYTRSTATSVIISKNYITSFEILSASGYYQAYVVNLTGSASSRASFTLNSWQHLVLKRASGTVTLTLDVADKAPFTSSGSVSSAGTDLLIGKRPGLAGFSPNSLIDDIRIFDQALDASDIAYLYNNGNGRGRTPSIYAVNGKDPIAAWIPSRDTAGNGTTTLTDLVGSNDGTLTNMDAATDWVADTDAGGIRALDFDGVNDYVEIPSSSDFQFGNGTTDSPFSVSFWIKQNGFFAGDFISRTDATATQRILRIILAGSSDQFLFALYDSTGANRIESEVSVVTIDDGDWHHVICKYDGSGNQSGLDIWFDDVQQAQIKRANGTYVAMENLSLPIRIARVTTLYSQFKADDIRIFDTALDATDIAYLYNSGNGRGIVATTPNTRRRRYAGGYGL